MKNTSWMLLVIVCVARCYSAADVPDVQDQHLISVAVRKDISYGLTRAFADDKYVCALAYAPAANLCPTQEELQELADIICAKSKIAPLQKSEMKNILHLKDKKQCPYQLRLISIILYLNNSFFDKRPSEFRIANVNYIPGDLSGGDHAAHISLKMPYTTLCADSLTGLLLSPSPSTSALKYVLSTSYDTDQIAEYVLTVENDSVHNSKDLVLVVDAKRLQEHQKSCSIQ